MKALNEDFTFDQLPEATRHEVLGAFVGVPTKFLYSPGSVFYRFVTPKKGDTTELAGNGVLDAYWWFDEKTRAHLSAFAMRQKISLAKVVRAGLGVTSNFNREMEYLCSILLTAPVYGWHGKARWQNDDVLKITYPGGSDQVYFPSLGLSPNKMTSSTAKLRMWAYLDDIYS